MLDAATTIAEALDSPDRKPARKAIKTAKKGASQKAKKPHRPARESTKTITNRLYSLWASIVRRLAGNKCEVCGRENTPSAPLNAHHIMPRQFFTGLRFDPKNSCCLCPKCHKLGKYSAHKGGIWFADWLRNKDDGRYSYCLSHAEDELDCKDRKALYDIEYDLHKNYPQYSSVLTVFKVTVLHKDGTVSNIVTAAYNKKAAEYIAACSGQNESPVKGILKIERYTDGCA